MKTVGINIQLEEEDYSVWSSGVRQNIFFFAETLKRSGLFEVLIVNTNPQVAITPKLSWDLTRFPTYNFGEVKDKLDVYFTMGSEILPQDGHYLRRRGCRIVHYVCGNRYIMDMEAILFKGGIGAKPDDSYLDEVWLIPQMVNTCRHFFEVFNRVPVREVPFVWSPEFLDKDAAQLPNLARYQHTEGPRRVSCFEPNLNVVKFCLYDMLIVEHAYRLRPDLIKEMHITNARTIKESERFSALVRQLEIVRKGIASFEGRFRMPYFLSKFTDIVVAHQWENALNYAYLDALYLGYPLVHNAHFIRDAGYYYDDFDVKTGAQQLLRAATQHGAEQQDYERRSAAVLARYRFDNASTVDCYADRITRLIEKGSSQ